MLTVASNYELKGLDRALRGLASLHGPARERARLLAVGEGPTRRWASQLTRLGVSVRCRLLAGRDDVPDLLQAADLLVHPARRDTTATVLLEAVAAGLPSLCTEACGYARHVRTSGAGVVLDEPFAQDDFDRELALLADQDLTEMGEAALRYADEVDLHGMHARIVDEVERRYGSRGAT
jgi:UDP-glucose:(heptosyl)LPS alpha-1,3-glucosyltransferase